MSLIIHYRNGRTINHSDTDEWKDISHKNEITSIDLMHDKKKIYHTVKIPEKNLGIFAHKKAEKFMGRCCSSCKYFETGEIDCGRCKQRYLKEMVRLDEKGRGLKAKYDTTIISLQQIADENEHRNAKNESVKIMNELFECVVKLEHLNLLKNSHQPMPRDMMGKEVGIILDKEGTCLMIEMDERIGRVVAYFDNIFKMGLNLNLFGIKL